MPVSDLSTASVEGRSQCIKFTMNVSLHIETRVVHVPFISTMIENIKLNQTYVCLLLILMKIICMLFSSVFVQFSF